MKLTTRLNLALLILAATACGWSCAGQALAQTTQPRPVELSPGADPVTAANTIPPGWTLLLPRGANYNVAPGRTIAPKPGVTVGAYGERDANGAPKLPRPRLMFTGGVVGIDITGKGVTLDSLVIDAVSSTANGKFPGIRIRDAADVKIENCVSRGWTFGVVAHRTKGLTIRGSLLADNFTRDRGKYGNAAGIYAFETDGLVMDRVSFAENGRKSIFDHGAYIAASCGPVTVTGCTFVANSSHGIQMRSGGDISDCLFVDNPIGLSHGLVNGSAVKSGGVSGTVERLVFIGGATIDGSKRGYVAEFGNAADTVARDLLAAHDSQKWDVPYLLNPCKNVTGIPVSPIRIDLARLLSYDWPGHPDRRGVLRTATAATGARERIEALPASAVNLRALLGDVEAAARSDPWTAARGVTVARKALGLDVPPQPNPEQEAARARLLEISARLTELTAQDQRDANVRAALDAGLRVRDTERSALQAERAELQEVVDGN
jgi:hypothetical protein